MKFIGIILLLLTSIFLIACSANQTSNKISNSELENLASKYGGVYVFNEKFAQEIDKQEQIRDSKRKEILERIKTIPDKNERNKKMREILKLEFYNNPEMQQILSNGKQYHTINTYQKAVNLSKTYIDKVINHIGQENYYKFTPDINVWSFYIDDNNNIVPIELTVTYNYKVKKYGLFGDEGRGFSLSKGEIHTARGGNKFILNNNKFEKVK
ncbi:tRNA 2-selenouridine synthase [Campylobacter concisus]|uniref:tRNA 2-selenouridine synthase n=1 Tax=Campylobacter concisus TaxID=199 RepID=A0A7S9WYX1_9BACT|nr:tRNA 2-selenouridine synthase [Campylobacter concisus]QPH98344.1 tRNA 2-selenouridine synthase [Campylobacter concisus]QPI05529.1 tRNA 2-selenouridine synthase [Campylobacter concisus]